MSIKTSDNRQIDPLNKLICDRVKSMRKKKNWTLDQLANICGVSRSMLSQIERGEANPTLGVAYRIAQAFGMTIGDLVDEIENGPRMDVIRSVDQNYLFRDDKDCRIRILSPLHLEKEVEFYELTLKPKGKLESASHFVGTREFLTIEKGNVRLSSGDQEAELGKGDSAHYSADVIHRIENIGRGEAIVFLVNIYDRAKSASSQVS